MSIASTRQATDPLAAGLSTPALELKGDVEHTGLGLAEFIQLGPIDQPHRRGVALQF